MKNIPKPPNASHGYASVAEFTKGVKAAASVGKINRKLRRATASRKRKVKG